ncbi:hypothetical protein Tco_0729603 [Tanacetum coccineum]|uniref:Retrovirus-related Pol polyprotein from transposon TNT 1-94-like beta-barrel domain-containing protein n=1 Tax=Tanacetum coccineum TaxID=301880 RepID=A0ABQ4YS42_9ASTR
MLMMQAQENGVALNEEQLLFIEGGQDNVIDEDVDEQPVQDLALNVDNVFQANDCDAFDSDVDEAPTAQTMFMANLSSADPVYDEADPSYDSDILSEEHDHDQYQDVVCEHHEEHEMHDDIQPNYVVDSHANYTCDSNMIPYEQYVKDNAVSVVQSNVSSVLNDAYMMIFNDMHEPPAQPVSVTTWNTVVNNALTAELATYKEQVELYERRARFELTEREQKINEQLRINKVAIVYKNPLCLTRAKQVQPALYNGYEIIKTNHVLAIVHNTEDTLEIAEITRRKINDKMKDPECVINKVKIAPPDYSKENYLATFTPQKQLTPEQIFWSQDLIKMKAEALKKQTTASRPIKALTVYPLNTPATLVTRVLPTKNVEPIPPPNRNNREVHLDYLRHLKERVETLHEIVEKAKVEQPLDRSIVFACRYTKHSQELLEYTIDTCPKDINKRDKKHAPTPLISKKQVTFEKQCDTSNSNTHIHVGQLNTQQTNVPVPSSTGVNCCTNASGSQPRSNTKNNKILPVKGVNKKKVEEHPRTNKSNLRTMNCVDSSSSSKRTVINSNSDSVCQTCNKCLISANHDMCVVDYLQSVKAPPSIHNSHNVVRKVKEGWKPKQVRQVWKPTGKVLTSVGHQWRPTGRIFTLGEQCPLTRLTAPKVVYAKQNKYQAITCANKQEPNQNWGSNFPNSPSSYVFKCRSYQIVLWYLDSGCSKHMTEDRSRLRNFMKKFIGTVRFENDHFGAIIGYGDYMIGDSVISRVYYVEGPGHNLFSVGQFCDSDLEVAFKKHICYV